MTLDVSLAAVAAVAVAALTGAGWLWFVYRHPTRPCHWCRGAACLVCKHMGYVPRPGARLVRRWHGGGRHGINGRQS